jgi:hypothetical protein
MLEGKEKIQGELIEHLKKLVENLEGERKA